MIRKVSEVASLLGSDRQDVKSWAYKFREHLGTSANPPKGEERIFEDSDVLALVLVASHWTDDSDFEEIGAMLEQGDHFEDRYREQLYMHTPILQDVPEGLDETWEHGCLYTPGFFTRFELPRNYLRCANTLLELAVRRDSVLDFRSPVLFTYRHALELYLKVLGEVDEKPHSLALCLDRVEQRMGGRMGEPYRSWILELDALDPKGTSFRYEDENPPPGLGGEVWIDYHHIRFVAERLFHELDMAILNDKRLWRNWPRI